MKFSTLNAEQKVSVFGVILVRIFPSFSCIRTEHGEVSISPYSVRMRENAGRMRTRITPNTDSFYVVKVYSKKTLKGNNLAELCWNIYLKDLKKKNIKNESVNVKNRKQKKSVFEKVPPTYGAFQRHVNVHIYSH